MGFSVTYFIEHEDNIFVAVLKMIREFFISHQSHIQNSFWIFFVEYDLWLWFICQVIQKHIFWVPILLWIGVPTGIFISLILSNIDFVILFFSVVFMIVNYLYQKTLFLFYHRSFFLRNQKWTCRESNSNLIRSWCFFLHVQGTYSTIGLQAQ